METLREILQDVVEAAKAYRDQQAHPDDHNAERDAAIAAAEAYLAKWWPK